MTQYFDIIGDIHGHADALEQLLRKMEYSLIDGCYRHATRQAIFLGDFIDRGTQQRKVLNVVMPMIEQGCARSVMGNHEFNALAYHHQDPHRRHPGSDNTWLRPRTNKNTHQHLAFLNEYLGTHNEKELEKVLAFFWGLPLWLDLEGVRVVHACWSKKEIEAARPVLNSDNTLTMDGLVKASMAYKADTGDSSLFDAIEILLKGVEFPMPAGTFFKDKDGVKRDKMRIKWWHNHERPLGEVAFEARGLDAESAMTLVKAEDFPGYSVHEKPVFLGHYWLKGTPGRLAENVACLDYSIAKDGKLVAYRWSGEQELTDGNFVFVEAADVKVAAKKNSH